MAVFCVAFGQYGSVLGVIFLHTCSILPNDPIPPSSRPWPDIARELARETNRIRVQELAEELNRALEEQEPKS
jgi:hypothetical protein